MQYSTIYPLKHWFVTVAITGPALLALVSFVSNNGFGSSPNGIGVLLFYVIFGMPLSLPVFFVYLLLYFWLVRRIANRIVLKLVLNIAIIGGVFFTLSVIISGSLIPILQLVYSVAVVITSFFFPINRHSDESTPLLQ